MKKNYSLIAFTVLLCFVGLSAFTQTTFNFTGSIDTYTVPAGATSIKIECYGAQGAGDNGTLGGLGAYMSGDFTVTPGQQFKILVGGHGTAELGQMSSGGGGGSFVTDMSNAPYVIAGGGGGSNGTPVNGDENAPTTNNGLNGYSPSNPSNYGVGGVGGNGATNGPSTPCAGNGGGLLTDGAPESCCGDSQFGIAFVNGGTANTGGGCGTLSPGGFGGGGSGGNYGCGGGGGYSGGGANYHTGGNGGGGGSFNNGTNQNNIAGANTGNGQIIITVLCDGLTTSVSGTTLCNGEFLTVSATSINGGNVTWDNGIINGTPYLIDTSGVVTYTATSDNSVDCAFSVDITVLSTPVFSLTTSDEFGGNDGGVYMTLTSGIFPFTFDWDNDGTGDFDDPQNLTNVGPGTYTVVVSHDNGCTATASATVNSQLSTSELEMLLQVYPNPTNDFVNITYTGQFNYTVSNVAGETLFTGNGVNAKKVAVDELAKGTYFITLNDGKTSYTSSFVKN